MTTAQAWNIWVAGSGEYEFEGTADEAETERAAKVRLTGTAGWKYRTGKDARESDRLTAEIVDLFKLGKQVSHEMLAKRSHALTQERGDGVMKAPAS